MIAANLQATRKECKKERFELQSNNQLSLKADRYFSYDSCEAKVIVQNILQKCVMNQSNIQQKTSSFLMTINTLTLGEDETERIKYIFKNLTRQFNPSECSKQWQKQMKKKLVKYSQDHYIKEIFFYRLNTKIAEAAKAQFESQQFSKILANLQISHIDFIFEALDYVQNNQTIVINVKIKFAIRYKLKTIFNRSKQYLHELINQNNFDSKSIKLLYQSIERQCSGLTILILKLGQVSQFQIFTINQSLQQLKNQILSNKNLQKLLQYFQKRFYMVEFDAFNHLEKTLSLLNQPNRQRFNNFLIQIYKFDYEFQFCKESDIYIKDYKSWWHGKLQQQNEVMYRKKLCFANYFIQTAPKGIVQYLHAQQKQKNKHMRLTMEKGQIFFLNFDKGYRSFISLKLQGKVKCILDLCESLIQLQQHGINHNDITIRNTIKSKDKFKLIDFDVARMVNIEFQQSNYEASKFETIKRQRQEIIKHTQYLMKKDIQNMNELVEYKNLPNEIDLLTTLKQQNFRQNFTEQERFKMICQYEKYIVGKRDCNKFALMILKLIYDGNVQQKIYSYDLHSRVQQIIRDIQKNDIFITNKYVKQFKIDVDSKNQKSINAQFLLLLTQLMIPQVEKRIPIKYFYYKIFQLFRINNQPLKRRPLTPKQTLPKYFNEKLINITSLMDRTQNDQRKKLIQIIQGIFRKNIQYSVQYHEKTMKIYDQLYTSQTNANQQQLQQQKPQANHGKKQPIVKEQRPNMCQIHQLTIQAQCCQIGCKKKWLCSECLYSLLFTAPDVANPLSHCKKINFSVTQPTLDYHKIIHFSEQIGHSEKIICLLVNKGQCKFKCSYCLQNTKNFDQWDKIYYVNMQKRIIYDCFNQQQLQNPKQKLIKQIYYKNNALYDSIFDNLNSNLTRDKQEELQQLLEITKRIVQDEINQMGKIHSQYISSMHSNSKFKKINLTLGQRPYLLKEIRNKKHLDLQDTNKLYELKEKAKDKNTDAEINLFNNFQYLLDQINIVSQNLYQKIQASLQQNKYNRSLYIITSPKAQEGYNLTQDIRKRFVSSRKIVEKIQPSTKTIQRQVRKKMKQKIQEQKQLQMLQIYSSIELDDDTDLTQQQGYQKPQNQKKNTKIYSHSTATSLYDQRFKIQNQQCAENKNKKNHSINQQQNKEKKQKNFYHRHDEQAEQTNNKINNSPQFYRLTTNYLKIKHLIQRITSQIGVDIISYIYFIQQMLKQLNNSSLKKFIFETLKKYIIEENVNKFNGILWIVMQFFKDIPKFMKVLVYSTQRYIFQIKKTTAIFKQTKKMLEKIEKDSFQTSQEWLTQKYKSINNNNNQDKPMLFYDINKRHWHRVQQLSIENIKQTNNDYAETKQKIKNLERNQLIKKLIRHHYNNLEVHIYWANFKSNRSHRLDFIQKFNNLKKIFIKDQPNYYNPAIFKSIDIQGLLNQVNQLKQMKLHCFNGFDIYCYELLKKKHPNCIVQLDLHSQKVIEFKWYYQVFPKQIQINVPFLLQGELIEWFDNSNILRAQFCLLFTNNITIQNTMKILEETTKRQASRLKLIFNTLRQYNQDDKNLSLYNVKQHFWLRIAFGTPKSNKIEQQINKKHSKLMPIFNPIKSKFIKIRYLTLHGVLINGGINQLAQAIQQNLKDFLSSLKVLQTLEIIKCFGLTFSILFQNLFTLKRLIIQQAVFRQQIIDKFPQFIQLQCLILRRVGLFQIASNGKLLSRQFGRILSKFKFSTLQTLIINEFYELENRQLQWIKKCPIKRLSLQRCFKINIEIYALIKSMTQLQHFDFTDTDIELKLFKQKMQVDGNFSKKVTIYNEIGNMQDSTIHNTKVLKQLMRIANYYEIKQLQKAFNKDQLKPLPLDIQQIKQITIENKKIRQRNQYYLFQILSKLPQLQNINCNSCQWRSNKINRTQILTYNRFQYIPQLSKLKELSLIKANLKKIEQTFIHKYQYLRKLVLRENPYLEDIVNLQFRQLVLLDLSQTGTKNILFDLKKVPQLKLINIQCTNIVNFPLNLLQSKSIRIIRTALPIKSYQKTNQTKQILFIQDIQNLLCLFEGGQIVDSLAAIKIKKQYESLDQKDQINHKNKMKIIEYNNACLCFCQNNLKQSSNNCQLLINYQLFKVEMQVKGKQYNYDQFCQKLIKQQQLSTKQENIQYQLMKIDSIDHKKRFKYELYSIQSINSSHPSAIRLFIFQNKYELFQKISQQEPNNYLQYGRLVYEFKNNSFSNFIIKKSQKCTKCQSDHFQSKKYEFINFLQEYTKKINELNIINPILSFSSFSIYKDEQICQFRITDLSKCILISSKKQSSIYQLIRFIIVNKSYKQIWKQSLDFFKEIIAYKKCQKYQNNQLSECQNQYKAIISKFEISILSECLHKIPNKEQTTQIIQLAEEQINSKIQEIISSLLQYKIMTNNLQLAILKSQIL